MRTPRLATAILRPFQEFFRTQVASGVVLLLAALVAIVWANSPWHPVLEMLLDQEFTIGFAELGLSQAVHRWINDGLMAVFFLLVGLEIKRELINGELSSPRRALLPIAGAIGGMVAPALVYAAFNCHGPGSSGWGIPMATDIAFSLGCVALLGRRVPSSLLVFLAALAIADDVGAVLIIAVFYTHSISWPALGFGALLLLLLVGLNLAGVRRISPYLLLGIALWLAVLKSGVHATIAGVLLGMVIPANTPRSLEVVLDSAESLVEETRPRLALAHDEHSRNALKDNTLLTLEELSSSAEAPSRSLEHILQPWTSYLIMPLFALANAGVHLSGASLAASLSQPITLGIALGLVIGKPAGIILGTGLVMRLGLASLPSGANLEQLTGIAILAGIGFTMSLFIEHLAFTDLALQEQAKVGILFGSAAAGLIGLGWLARATRR